MDRNLILKFAKINFETLILTFFFVSLSLLLLLREELILKIKL